MQQLPLPEKVFYFGLFPLFVLLLLLKVTALQSAPVQRACQTATPHQIQAQTKHKARPLQLSTLWAKIPFCISFAMLAFLVLWRSRQRHMAYITSAGFIFLATSELIPLGAHELISASYSRVDLALALLGSVGVGLIMYFTLHLPVELPEDKRLSKKWAYAAAFFDAMARVLFFTSVHTATIKTKQWIWVGDTLVAALFIFVLVHNYFASSALGRRRSRWIIYGGILGNSPWIIGAICMWLVPTYTAGIPWTTLGHIAMPLVPLGFLVSLLADDLMQVDGPSKVAIVFVSALLLIAVGVQMAIPWFAGQFALHFSISPQAGHFGLSILFVCGLCVLAIRLYSRVLRYFLPEQRFITEGIAQLQAKIDGRHTPEEMLTLLGTTLHSFLSPERCLALLRQDNKLALLLDSAPSHAMPVGAAEQDILSHPPGQGVALHLHTLTPSHPTKIATLSLQPKKGWEGAVWLGPKRSRAPYTDQEVHILQAMVKFTEESIRARLQEQAMKEHLRWMANLQESYAAVLGEQKEQANQFAMLNHDLKQPLEAIRLLSELLEERPLDQQSQSLLSDLHASALSLRSMLHESLDQAKQRALHTTSTCMNFQLGYLEERLHALFASQAATKGLDFELDFAHHEVYSDPQLLERILLNLLSNAIRYTDTGYVKGSARAAGVHVEICIEDTGRGFEEGALKKATQAWSRLEPEAASGHGLGLAITAQLAAHLDIELDVASTPKEGSLFRLSLPKAPSPK